MNRLVALIYIIISEATLHITTNVQLERYLKIMIFLAPFPERCLKFLRRYRYFVHSSVG